MSTIKIFDKQWWYIDKTPLWIKILNFFVWPGGWQTPVWNEKGEYTYKFRFIRKHTFKGKTTRRFKDPYPLTVKFFGIDVTFFGTWLQIRLKKGTIVIIRRHSNKSCYFSPDGTPDNATKWYWGAPKRIKDEIQTPPYILERKDRLKESGVFE